jgi:hypothetical protein
MDANIEYLSLADGIGFEQIMIGDIIVMDRVRLARAYAGDRL